MKHPICMLAMLIMALNACSPRSSQNQYKSSDVGVSHNVEFGTIVSRREVNINVDSTGYGTLGGAAAGAGAGSYVGNGSGSMWAAAGAAVAGAVAGTVAEQQLRDHKGDEYIVQLQSGETKSIVQEKVEGEPVFKAGDSVMLQYCDSGEKSKRCMDKSAGYERLMPVDKLPPYVKKQKRIIVDEQ